MSVPKLVIGNRNYSSWSLRPWLVMKMAGFAFEEVTIPLDHPGTAAEIGRYSPAGRVPVLIDGDLHIWDSLAIIEYVAEANPQVWPAERAARARARSLSAEMHAGFTAVRERYPMNIRATGRRIEPGEPEKQDIERIRGLLGDALARSGGPMLFGAFCAADAMFAPVVMRFRTYGIDLGEGAQQWAETLSALSPVRDWIEAARKETWMIEHEEVGE